MPTPIEILLDPISLLCISMYAALFIAELVFPAVKARKSLFWYTKGIMAFMVFFYLSSYLPLLWDTYLAKFQLVDLTSLNTLAATAIGILVYEAGIYFWHRSLHGSDVLWRYFHQFHHSAEHIDIPSAFWFSPLDMVAWTALGSICLVLGVGVSAEAATNIILITTFFSLFQHANIRTPKWLGYFVQRPEAHTIHHASGVHKYNYSDLPIFDIVFGTFKHADKHQHQVGFHNGASNQIADMLIGKDISLNKHSQVENVKANIA